METTKRVNSEQRRGEARVVTLAISRSIDPQELAASIGVDCADN